MERDQVFPFLYLILISFILQSCAGDFSPISSASHSNQSSNSNTSIEAKIKNRPGVRVSFHFSDYYSLSIPRTDTSCAGDIKNYYDTFDLEANQSSPLKFPLSEEDPTTSAHPAFVKNVSVDLTNAQSNTPLNASYGCSIGSGPSIPPASSCATFDYGAIGGLPTHLGGSILLVGGLSNAHTSFPSISCGPLNACQSQAYALGIHTLPASAATEPPNALAPGVTSASGPLSTWANLSSATEYAGPKELVGSAIAYDQELERLITFSGTSPLDENTPTGSSAPHQTQWYFDIKTQSWSTSQASSFIANDLQTMLDQNSTTGTTQQWQKPSGSRFAFGYRATQGFALNQMSSNGVMTSDHSDRTDRILILGGSGSYGYDTRKFNPTYGPEWNDVSSALTGQPHQWLDSYPTQMLFNHMSESQYRPKLGGGSPTLATNFAFIAARNYSLGNSGAGYLYALGGFDSQTSTSESPAAKHTPTDQGGAFNLFWRGPLGSESSTEQYSGMTNYPDGTTSGSSQLQWQEVSGTFPWLGAAQLLPGFNLHQNEMVFFGGTNCRNYLMSTSSGCTMNTTGSHYWRIGPSAIDATTTPPSPVLPQDVAFDGTAPSYAGIAADRGVDPAGNIMIVAFGGAKEGGVTDDSKIYYLYQNGTKPTWVSTSSLNTPPAVAEGTLVFSHVTRKFYLFGGYHSGTRTVNGDTWELSMSNPSGGPAACTTAGTCTFTWKPLTPEMSCYPHCPQVRRSHRMAEVNYYHRDTSSDGEASCSSASEPCSYGIFMEGGTTDGVTPLTDRWMFDPTAQNGKGHWQLMGELPPRNFAAMTAVDYFIPTQNKVVHRAVLFGGETGLSNPQLAAQYNSNPTYFVAPTLGDSWMYDFDQNTWNRIKLLGKGWKGGFPTSFSSEAEARESYAYDPTSLKSASELSPPPLSGSLMVTRTVRNPTHQDGAPTSALAIPEIFLFGGRQKDGTLLPFNQVYKFCVGSTGEKPYPQSPKGTSVGGEDDASCDAYDSSTNPYSPSPTQEYKGRWIRKTPSDSDQKSSFLGKAVYDSFSDRIILIGGLSGTSLPASVTDSKTHLRATITIHEYTPPSKTQGSTPQTEGSWSEIPTCAGSPLPEGRYGHSLSYDLLNHQLVLVGGYDSNGAPLTQSMTYYDGRTYELPETWVAKRSKSQECYTWSSITEFSNSIDLASQKPPMSGLAHAASIFIPADGYNTGFYTLLDKKCNGAGPVGVADESFNKLLAGGVYFDLDRKKLGDQENLLLHLKYIPMGTGNIHSDSTPMNPSESAYFKIHLIKTKLGLPDLRLALQPRYLLFADSYKYPEIVQSISVLAPPTLGQIQEEQILLPISIDPDIDRIRIERYSGSGILIDASLYRLGGKDS